MYSQNDEEAVILEIVSRRGINGGPKAGRFMDIGAYDGKTFSNTAALAERGWHGVCVEPTFQAFKALAEFHKGREKQVELVNAMVEPMTTYRQNGLGLRRFWASPDAVATSDPNHMEKWKAVGQFQPIWIPAINPRLLAATFPGPFHVLNIDCEGAATLGLFNDYLSIGDIYGDFLGAICVCVEFDGAHKDAMIAAARTAKMKHVHTTSENLIFERA